MEAARRAQDLRVGAPVLAAVLLEWGQLAHPLWVAAGEALAGEMAHPAGKG